MTGRASNSASYRPFGTFRLVLAVLVLLQHFVANLAPLPVPAFFEGNAVGSVAVLVFFALSGFVIVEAAVLFYDGRPGAFLTNRLLRIVPHFLLAVVLSIAIQYVFTRLGTLRLERNGPLPGPEAFAAKNVLLNILSFLPVVDRKITWNFLSIAWAIRVEMAFYFVVAASLFVTSFVARRGIRVSLGGVLFFATMGLVPLFILAQLGKAPPMFQFVPYFVFGAALYFAVAEGSRTAGFVTVAALVGICLHFLSLPVERAGTVHVLRLEFCELMLLIAVLSVLATLQVGNLEAGDREIGELTYPLYLQHENLMVVALAVTVGYSSAAFVSVFAASLLAAKLFNSVVDPFVDLVRDRIRGRTVRATEEAVFIRRVQGLGSFRSRFVG